MKTQNKASPPKIIETWKKLIALAKQTKKFPINGTTIKLKNGLEWCNSLIYEIDIDKKNKLATIFLTKFPYEFNEELLILTSKSFK